MEYDINVDGKWKREFNGIITNSKDDGLNYQIQSKDNSQKFYESLTGGAFGAGVSTPEVLYYLAMGVLPDATFPKNIYVDQNKTLADEDWRFQKKRYVFVAPIPSTVVDEPSLKIANSWLYAANSKGCIEDRIIAKYFENDIPLEFKDGVTRARLYVYAEGLSDAFDKGKNRLRKLLDYLSFSANFSAPAFGRESHIQYHSYDRRRTLINIKETPWALVRDTLRADRYWLQWFAPFRNDSSFSISGEDPTADMHPLFQDILETDDQYLTSIQRSILNALHALRQCRQSDNETDALDHVWRCMEFLVSGFSVQGLFEESEVKALLKSLSVFVSENCSKDRIKEKEQRIKSILAQQLNQASLRTKWKSFCLQYDVPISTEDEDFLWKLRISRNKHQHGQGTSVDRTAIIRAANIMEKALIAVVIEIGVGAQEKPA